MKSTSLYSCVECERSVHVKKEDPVPRCCGEEMRPVNDESCTSADHPEMVRNDRIDGACDDGRGKE